MFRWLLDGFDLSESEKLTGEVLFWLDGCTR